jgi:hypothetical protein
MKKILAALAVVGCIAAVAMFAMNTEEGSVTFFKSGMTQDEKEFITFIAKYKKSYLTKHEYAARLNVFRDNLAAINANTDSGVTLAVNKFADLSSAEFKASYTGLVTATEKSSQKPKYLQIGLYPPPPAVDWEALGGVGASVD